MEEIKKIIEFEWVCPRSDCLKGNLENFTDMYHPLSDRNFTIHCAFCRRPTTLFYLTLPEQDSWEVAVNSWKAPESLSGNCVYHFLDCSTAHITAGDSGRLEDLCRSSRIVDDLSFPRVISHEYGHIIFMPGERESLDDQVLVLKERGFSPAVGNILNYAFEHGCWLINLDCDGEKIDGLETHDW